MARVKIGIIGTGVGIRTHLNGFRLFEDAEVVAICGSSLSRSQEFATKYNIPVAYATYKELCDNPEIDLVCVTSPNRFHYDATKYAISKNKHIICEKPLSNNIEEIKSLVDRVKNYPKIAVVDHQLRFNPYIKKIKKLINNGDLGTVYSVKLNQQGNGFVNQNAVWNWSFDENEGGGVRLAMASHFTDLIQYWFENPQIINVNGYMNPVTKERIDNNGNLHEVTASTICTAYVNFENELNVMYSINAGSYMPSRFDISIFGTKGELTFSLQDKIILYLRTKVGEKQMISVDGVYPDEADNKVSIFSSSFRYFAPLIIQSIQTDDFSKIANAATFKDAQYNINLLDAIKQSANNGTGIIVGKEINQYV
jgi:predicted dehydrogenase